MADKFLNTGQGAVNLSNGTVNIIAAELGAVNLQASKPVKTNATKQLVSGDLDIADITNLQSELTTKTELNYVEDDSVRVTPAAGELKLYAKTDNHFYKMDDTGDEKQIGNVFSNTMPSNHSLAIFQGGSGQHIVGSSIIYNQNLSALENVELISNNTDQIFLLPGTIELITSTVAIKGNTDFYNNNVTNVLTLNGIVPINILQNTGATPMTGTYTPSVAQDIATKDYVDNHNTSGNYVKTNGTSTMTGNLNLGSQNITGANEVSLNVINKQGVQTDIRVNTNPYFDISGGDFGSILRLIADESNLNNDAGEIHFYQDGSILSGAVLMNGATKTMNVVSCGHSGAGGLEFKVGGVSDSPYTAPTKMTIGQNGDVVLEDSIRVKSTNEFEFGFGDATKNQFSGRCTYKGFSLFALDFVGAAVGAADRQVQIYEDLTLKAVIQTSDERLKHHIRPIEIKMAGELIDNLQPKCFMWKNIDRLTGEVRDFTDHHCYMGLIAQEVKTTQDMIGDAMGEKLRISRNPKNEKDFMSVSYTQLIAPMMKCIQDLRTRVSLLEEKINSTV